MHKSRKIFNMDVTETMTVMDLKQIIGRRIGMPPEDQVLTLKGVFLEDAHPLGDYRIPKPDIVVPVELYLRANYKKPTSVRVSLSSENTIPLFIRLDAKVSELRSYVEEVLGISPEKASELRLIFDHWILEDNEVLERYGVKKNSCIVVARRLVNHRSSIDANKPENVSDQDSMPKVTLNIMINNGEVFTDSFEKKITLSEVKEKIAERIGFSVTLQSFSFREGLKNVTDLALSLEQLGLRNGDTMYLTDARSTGSEANGSAAEKASSDNMILHFKDAQNDYSIAMHREATVQDAMDALRKVINGNSGPLWLKNTVDGNFMQDSSLRLMDLGIKSDTIIEYVYLPAKTDWTSKQTNI